MAGPPVAAAAPVTSSFEDDWEEYDPKSGLTFTDHMIAGSCAGLMEHIVMYPVDTLKVRVCVRALCCDSGRGGWGRVADNDKTMRTVGMADVLQTHMQASRDLRGGAAPHFREVWTEVSFRSVAPRIPPNAHLH